MKQVMVLMLLAASAMACGSGTDERQAETTAGVAVRTAAVEMRELDDTIDVGGTVRSATVAVMTSRVVGQLLEINARPGAHVRAGTVLAVLDGREMDANRERADSMLTAAVQGHTAAEADKAAADAGLKLAIATHGRIAQLRDRKSATAQELDEAQAALSAAQARAAAATAAVSAASANLSGARAAAEAARISAGYSRIVAPFDGIVTQRHVDEGAMAMPGTPIVTIEEQATHQVEVHLDDTRAARVNWSQSPRVVFTGVDGADVTVPGRIVERAVALDNAHTVVVKVALPAGSDVRTGMFARVRFSGGPRRGLAVPADAIVQRGQLDAVFVVADGRARYRVLEVGRAAGDFVEVRSGVAAGERVVRAVPASLVDGMPVKPAGGQQ